MLLAASKKRIMKTYKHLKTFLIIGSIVALILFVFDSLTMISELKKVFGYYFKSDFFQIINKTDEI